MILYSLKTLKVYIFLFNSYFLHVFKTHSSYISFLDSTFQEFASVTGKNPKAKGSRKSAKSELVVSKGSNIRSKELEKKVCFPKANARKVREKNNRQQHIEEPQVKEEGEVSESEQERYQQFKEEKWMEWCSDVMEEQMQTLKRLEKLQTTSVDLPKEKVPQILFRTYEL